MPDRPLLLFPTPQLAERTKPKNRPFGQLHKPDVTKQGKRLSPMFAELQDAFEERRVEIQQNATGINPEEVLVIETIGGVENFARAVKQINGLEWMGEFECVDIVPDEDFYDEISPDKELVGRLYLVMTNYQALKEMLSLWSLYQANPNMKFSRGLTKFRDVFRCLKSVRRWGVQDRLLETGALSSWEEELRCDSNRVIRFEAELWFRGSSELQKRGANRVTDHVRQVG